MQISIGTDYAHVKINNCIRFAMTGTRCVFVIAGEEPMRGEYTA